MNKLIAHHHFFRENIVALIGVCLCLYFSYHALLGHRSVLKLHSLEMQIETMSQKNTDLERTKESLQKKVVMMRPGGVNKDLLEEQVRLVLGYRQADELVLLGN
ncbi:MAG: septum formation initiator family protein [Rhodospirillales bacterium]|nr:septum formation initiator family protein [Rhodospirillales bacterium]